MKTSVDATPPSRGLSQRGEDAASPRTMQDFCRDVLMARAGIIKAIGAELDRLEELDNFIRCLKPTMRPEDWELLDNALAITDQILEAQIGAANPQSAIRNPKFPV